MFYYNYSNYDISDNINYFGIHLFNLLCHVRKLQCTGVYCNNCFVK